MHRPHLEEIFLHIGQSALSIEPKVYQFNILNRLNKSKKWNAWPRCIKFAFERRKMKRKSLMLDSDWLKINLPLIFLICVWFFWFAFKCVLSSNIVYMQAMYLWSWIHTYCPHNLDLYFVPFDSPIMNWKWWGWAGPQVEGLYCTLSPPSSQNNQIWPIRW